MKEERNKALVPMQIEEYNLSDVRKSANERMVSLAEKVVLIFNKEHIKAVADYLLSRPDLEQWEIDAIADEPEFDECYKAEQTRIKEIERYVGDLGI